MSNLTLRILTALVGAPLLLGATYYGGWAFTALVALMVLAAQWEFYQMLRAGGWTVDGVWGMLLGACCVLRAQVAEVGVLAVVGVVVYLAYRTFRAEAGEAFLRGTIGTLVGVAYPALLFSYLLDLRLATGPLVADLQAFYLTLTLFLLIWATDTFAYFTGKSLGKHPLAPAISPKKTWEGAIGGAVGAVLVAVALKMTLLDFLAWPHVLVMALLGGVFSQVGDLGESKFKRAVGVKDSGNLLPGHGGVLDRFDALILAAPLVFFYLKYVARLYG